MIALEEMRNDLDDTNKDIERLQLIVDNLNLFMKESGNENRNFVKMDILRYSKMLRDGQELKQIIEQKINECLELNE